MTLEVGSVETFSAFLNFLHCLGERARAGVVDKGRAAQVLQPLEAHLAHGGGDHRVALQDLGVRLGDAQHLVCRGACGLLGDQQVLGVGQGQQQALGGELRRTEQRSRHPDQQPEQQAGQHQARVIEGLDRDVAQREQPANRLGRAGGRALRADHRHDVVSLARAGTIPHAHAGCLRGLIIQGRFGEAPKRLGGMRRCGSLAACSYHPPCATSGL